MRLLLPPMFNMYAINPPDAVLSVPPEIPPPSIETSEPLDPINPYHSNNFDSHELTPQEKVSVYNDTFTIDKLHKEAQRLISRTLPVNLPVQSYIKPCNDSLMILVLSTRYNFKQRQMIRETWGQNHSNIYFLVGKSYPPYRQYQLPTPENPYPDILKRLSNHTNAIDAALKMDDYTSSRLDIINAHLNLQVVRSYDGNYLSRQEEATKQLSIESSQYNDVILLNMVDSYHNLTLKVISGLNWAINFNQNMKLLFFFGQGGVTIVSVDSSR